MPSTSPSGNAVVLAVAGMFVATLIAAVCLGIAISDGARAATLIGLMFAALASAVPSVLAVAKIGSVSDKVDQVASDTADLANGKMDAKIRAGVADVLAPHLVDPDTLHQLVADRARRDQK